MKADHEAEEKMSKTAKYTPLDSEGPEVLQPSEAPEVVQDGNRRSSLLMPEVYDAAPYYAAENKEKIYHGGTDGEAPEHYVETPISPEQAARTPVSRTGIEEGEKDGGRTYCCGLRRRGMIILVAAIVLLVIVVGAVLGGVLGTQLRKKKTASTSIISNSPIQTFSNTGIASTISSIDANHLLTYFQDPSGRILENSYYDNTWTLSNATNIHSSIVTTSAVQGSPLAAISYTLKGSEIRQVFFVSSTGFVMATHSNTTFSDTKIATGWSPAVAISDDAIAANSIGLSACSSSELFNGIRVFYPSQYHYVQELIYTFGGNNTWKQGDYWKRADVGSGFGCAVKLGPKRSFLNLYYRLSNGTVHQVWNEYKNGGDWQFYSGPNSWANESMAAGSDLAVTGDSRETEYVYYQLESGVVTRGILNPTATTYETFDDMDLSAATGTRMAAAFINGGSLLLYQNSTNDTTLWTDNVSRYGATIMNSVVL